MDNNILFTHPEFNSNEKPKKEKKKKKISMNQIFHVGKKINKNNYKK